MILWEQYALCDGVMYRKCFRQRMSIQSNSSHDCHALVTIHEFSVNNLLEADYSYVQISTAPSLFSAGYKQLQYPPSLLSLLLLLQKLLGRGFQSHDWLSLYKSSTDSIENTFQQFIYCWKRIRYHGNMFTEPLQSNVRLLWLQYSGLQVSFHKTKRGRGLIQLRKYVCYSHNVTGYGCRWLTDPHPLPFLLN